MDRILLRMGKDQYEIAKLLKEELDRVTERYETSQRLQKDSDSWEDVADTAYWRGQKKMVCYVAEDIAEYYQDKALGYPTEEYYHAKLSQEYSTFLQKVGCAD